MILSQLKKVVVIQSALSHVIEINKKLERKSLA